LNKRKKYKDPRPYFPTAEDLREKEERQRRQKISVRLDQRSLMQLEQLQLSEGKDRSELIRIAVSEFAEKERQKKLTLELEAKQKAEASTRDDKGNQIEEAYMRKLLFNESAFGWSEASV
jgi:Arc/MetJ-type ribon-helix-helix transcriptional regulator